MATFIWTAAPVYVVGAIGTLIFDIILIRRLEYIGLRPLALLRNTVLWPIFLPILISIARSEDR